MICHGLFSFFPAICLHISKIEQVLLYAQTHQNHLIILKLFAFLLGLQWTIRSEFSEVGGEGPARGGGPCRAGRSGGARGADGTLCEGGRFRMDEVFHMVRQVLQENMGIQQETFRAWHSVRRFGGSTDDLQDAECICSFGTIQGEGSEEASGRSGGKWREP